MNRIHARWAYTLLLAFAMLLVGNVATASAATNAELLAQVRSYMRVTTVGKQIDDARVNRGVRIEIVADTTVLEVCGAGANACYHPSYRTVYLKTSQAATNPLDAAVTFAHELTHALDDDVTTRYHNAYGRGYSSAWTEVRAFMVGAQVALGLGFRSYKMNALVDGQLQSPQRIELAMRSTPVYAATATNTVSVFSLVPLDSGHDTVDAIVRNWTKWSIPLTSSVVTTIPTSVEVDAYVYHDAPSLFAWRWSGTTWQETSLMNGSPIRVPANSTNPGLLKDYSDTWYHADRKVARYSCTTGPANRYVKAVRTTALYQRIATGGAQLLQVPTSASIYVYCGNAHRDATTKQRSLLRVAVQVPGSTTWRYGWVDVRDLVQR